MGKRPNLQVIFYFTHRSSPEWPYPSVFFRKGSRCISANSYSKGLESALEERLNGETK